MTQFIKKIKSRGFIFGITDNSEIIMGAQTGDAILKMTSFLSVRPDKHGAKRFTGDNTSQNINNVLTFLRQELGYKNIKVSSSLFIKKVWILKTQQEDQAYMIHLTDQLQEKYEIYN